jgi:AcrR family transcriptional regulator
VTRALTEDAVAAFRKQLTALATQLYLRDGLDALSLRNLAKEGGVSRSTPYNYFASKQDIVDSVRAAGFDRLTERCRAALAEEPGILERMRLLGWTLVQFARAEPKLYRLMFSGPVFSGDVARPLQEAIARFREVSRPPLDEALKKRWVRGDPETLRRATWAAFHGLISLHLDGHFESPKQLERDFGALNEIIGYGILTERAPKKRRRKK